MRPRGRGAWPIRRLSKQSNFYAVLDRRHPQLLTGLLRIGQAQAPQDSIDALLREGGGRELSESVAELAGMRGARD